MLHVLKKNFARFKQPLAKNNLPNTEFSDLRQRLCTIKVALKYTLSMLNSANRIWVLQIQQQRQFSEKFHEAYPTTDDDTYTVAKYFADESQALYATFLRESVMSPSLSKTSPVSPSSLQRQPHHRTSASSSPAARRNEKLSNDDIADDEDPMAVYAHILSEIRSYVAEIEGVESMYGGLMEVRSESDRYQQKVDAIQQATPNTVRPNRRPVDESKRQRNIHKLDVVKEEYKKRLTETVDRQKMVYMKYPVVFKAALTAYWLSHQKHVTALVHSLKKTEQFATTYEHQMRTLDVASLTEQQVLELQAVDTSLVVHNPHIVDPAAAAKQNNSTRSLNAKQEPHRHVHAAPTMSAGKATPQPPSSSVSPSSVSVSHPHPHQNYQPQPLATASAGAPNNDNSPRGIDHENVPALPDDIPGTPVPLPLPDDCDDALFMDPPSSFPELEPSGVAAMSPLPPTTTGTWSPVSGAASALSLLSVASPTTAADPQSLDESVAAVTSRKQSVVSADAPSSVAPAQGA